jgi:hypothetical protein
MADSSIDEDLFGNNEEEEESRPEMANSKTLQIPALDVNEASAQSINTLKLEAPPSYIEEPEFQDFALENGV